MRVHLPEGKDIGSRTVRIGSNFLPPQSGGRCRSATEGGAGRRRSPPSASASPSRECEAGLEDALFAELQRRLAARGLSLKQGRAALEAALVEAQAARRRVDERRPSAPDAAFTRARGRHRWLQGARQRGPRLAVDRGGRTDPGQRRRDHGRRPAVERTGARAPLCGAGDRVRDHAARQPASVLGPVHTFVIPAPPLTPLAPKFRHPRPHFSVAPDLI